MFFKDPCFDVKDYEQLHDEFAGTLYKAVLNETGDVTVSARVVDATFKSIFAQITTIGFSQFALYIHLHQRIRYYIDALSNSAH